MKSTTRYSIAVFALLGALSCRRTTLVLSTLDLKKPTTQETTHEFAVGEAVRYSVRVSGLEIDDRMMYSLQTDLQLLAQTPERPGEWKPVWTSYAHFRENRPAAQEQASVHVQADFIPPVQPGSYRVRVTVRDVEAMTSSHVESEIRLIPPVSAREVSTQTQPGHIALTAATGAGDAFLEGFRRYQGGDLSGALEAFLLAASRTPDYPELNFNIGVCYLGLGNRSKAREYLQAELRRDPVHMGTLGRLGDMSFEDKDYASAVDYYTGLAEHAPNHFYSHFKLGEVYLDQREYARSIKSFERVLEIDPTNDWASINLGSAYFRMGDNAAALRIYERLAAKEKPSAIVCLNYAKALATAGDYKNAYLQASRAQQLGAAVDEQFLAQLEQAAGS